MNQRPIRQLVPPSLDISAGAPYTINMKPKNISLSIAFGLILTFVGGYAFAGAMNELQGGPNFDGAAPRSGDVKQPKPEPAAPAPAAVAGQKDNVAGSVPALEDKDKKGGGDKKEEEKKNPVMEFLGKHKTEMFVGALGGYLGFALMGPAGIVTGVLVALGIAFLANA
ncbi:MAG: hypothetical protein A2X28_07815 [Elusimicrobia bacterium GWA2_56_46]|nr:MAG: hypothetical protein A2X28_07815 [Elusimicrobia bacterium GWA2_56_46]OGR53777.1 MAG: hypothetical protein A2X39_06615 [Elusimicrobia bacterium GWC2_56_31]HBB65885.1 hypothetical protein [Elusimicrobiota bacterium]HBW22629.1 hypothetical protein [Elusimicrobiota bacterium]